MFIALTTICLYYFSALSSSGFELTEWAIVGIVFGSLIFVNILAIILGLAYRQSQRLKKINSVGSLEETQPAGKQDNVIVRNTLSSRSNGKNFICTDIF